MQKKMPVEGKNRPNVVQTPRDQIHLVAAILTSGLLPRDMPSDKPNSAANLALRLYRAIARSLLNTSLADEGTEDANHGS